MLLQLVHVDISTRHWKLSAKRTVRGLGLCYNVLGFILSGSCSPALEERCSTDRLTSASVA